MELGGNGREPVSLPPRYWQASYENHPTCIFCTDQLSKEEMVRFYFDKDLIEKAFHTLKGIARLQRIRHWLYNRVVSHVFICYLAYLLLSLLQYRLRKKGITAEEALTELQTMYKVYMCDKQKGFKISRIVTLNKKQELILKTINKKLIKTQCIKLRGNLGK